MKISSRFIYNFIKEIWNLTACEIVIFPVWINAPPFIKMVAASGTCKTRYPIYFKWRDNVARAVVLPAQGPPVKQILVIGNFPPFIASLSFAWETIGSSMILRDFFPIEISSLSSFLPDLTTWLIVLYIMTFPANPNPFSFFPPLSKVGEFTSDMMSKLLFLVACSIILEIFSFFLISDSLFYFRIWSCSFCLFLIIYCILWIFYSVFNLV